jgi:hypothetical protein
MLTLFLLGLDTTIKKRREGDQRKPEGPRLKKPCALRSVAGVALTPGLWPMRHQFYSAM